MGFFFLFCFFVFADVHMLNYFYTAVPAGINFPEFIAFAVFDEEPIMCYKNSNSGALDISKWIENCETENYWKNLMQDMQNNQDNFNKTFATVLNGFNHGKGKVELIYIFTVYYICFPKYSISFVNNSLGFLSRFNFLNCYNIINQLFA